MNVLFITMVWPISPADSNLYSDLMDEFVIRNHNVCIATLCEKRNNIQTSIKQENGMEVLRVKCGNIQKTNKFNKVFSSFIGGFLLKNYILKFYKSKKIDLIIFALPPLTITSNILKIKKRFNSKLYLLLKEFWPQDPADLGALKVGGFVWNYFKKLEFKLLKNSNFIGTMSKKGIDYVKRNYPNIDSIVEINTNSEKDKGFLKLSQNEKNKIKGEFGIDFEKKIFIFGGNLGVSQGIDEMICSIKACSDLNEIVFIIVGDGTEKMKLKRELSLQPNVVFFDMLKKKEYEILVKACDFGLIFLSPKFTIPNIPSRVVTYLMYGLPIIVSANDNTDIGEIIEKNGCGYALINGDFIAFRNDIIKIMSENYDYLSNNCIKLFKDSFSTSISCQTILSHFK